jgi:tRNA pseudouridine13 synthase
MSDPAISSDDATDDAPGGAPGEPPAPDDNAYLDPCAYLTADVPPVGGRLKERPEDFLVEELPAYEPSGSGEHLYLYVEKRDISTMHMVYAIARHFGVRHRDVGYAGLKDKVAVTRQLVSVHVPGKGPESFPAFEHPRIHVLWSDLHANKLRQGHLAGNRFMIRIRGAPPAKAVHAHRVLERLASVGVPNRAGEQRFGHMGNNHVIGRLLLSSQHRALVDELLGPSRRLPDVQAIPRGLYAEGKYESALAAFSPHADTERRVLRALIRGRSPEKAVYVIEQMQKRYFITAFQSAVFNSVLDQRLREGLLGGLREGDLAWKHDNGAVFAVDAPTLADSSTRERLSGLEISPSGPMWGPDMMEASGVSGQVERAALEATGITPEMIIGYGERARDPVPGKRRALRVPLSFPDVEGGVDEHGPYVKCVFELPPGSFATVVLREVMKPDLAVPSDRPPSA